MHATVRLRPLLVVAAVLLPGTAALAEEAAGRTAVAKTPHFAFHSDLVTNLHDALLVAGRARAAGEGELFAAGTEAECFAGLAPSERAGWDRAVDWYAEIVSPAEWSDRRQLLLRFALAAIEDGGDDDRARRFVSIARGMMAAASPAYETCRWPAQDAGNRRWIAELQPLLAAHETAIAERLERHYATPWHGLPIDVDVVAHAPPVGANSILKSPAGGHVLINGEQRGHQALESVFHEASHTLSAGWRGDPLPQALEAAAGELAVELPGDLWHVVLFWTTGETVRRVLEAAGEPGYTPLLYAAPHFGRGPWGRYRAAVEKVWPAYLDGERDLATAARELLREVAAGERAAEAAAGEGGG